MSLLCVRSVLRGAFADRRRDRRRRGADRPALRGPRAGRAPPACSRSTRCAWRSARSARWCSRRSARARCGRRSACRLGGEVARGGRHAAPRVRDRARGHGVEPADDRDLGGDLRGRLDRVAGRRRRLARRRRAAARRASRAARSPRSPALSALVALVRSRFGPRLLTAVDAVAGAGLLGFAGSAGLADRARRVILAQISDPHVTVGPGDAGSAEALAAAVAAVAALDPRPGRGAGERRRDRARRPRPSTSACGRAARAAVDADPRARRQSRRRRRGCAPISAPPATPASPCSTPAARAAAPDRVRHDGRPARTTARSARSASPGSRRSWTATARRRPCWPCTTHPSSIGRRGCLTRSGSPRPTARAGRAGRRQPAGQADRLAGHVHRGATGGLGRMPRVRLPELVPAAGARPRARQRDRARSRATGLWPSRGCRRAELISHVVPIGDYGPPFRLD